MPGQRLPKNESNAILVLKKERKIIDAKKNWLNKVFCLKYNWSEKPY